MGSLCLTFCQLCPDLALLVVHSCILDCGKDLECHNSRLVQIGLIVIYACVPSNVHSQSMACRRFGSMKMQQQGSTRTVYYQIPRI